MKILFLFHDQWERKYPKADWVASRFPTDGFVVIKKRRPWWGAYLWKRARRLGFRKVADEVLLRLSWVLFQSRRDRRMTRKLCSVICGGIFPPGIGVLRCIASTTSIRLKPRCC